MRLFSAATPEQQAVLDEPYRSAAYRATLRSLAADDAGVKLADSEISYGLAGRLYLSKSGWLLLSVPNALGRGFFDALHEHGVELPTRDTDDPNEVFNAHISVMRADEVAKIGADKISERGHTFRYTTGAVKEITPGNWNGVSRVWALTILSPELKNLRKSYGLSPLPGPNGDWDFHVTFAIRRTKVLQPGAVTKAANGDMLAFKAWKATGLSDEEADRKAGESLELPGEKKITPRTRHKRIHEEEYDVCPHCEKEIGEKAIYIDPDRYVYHRPCRDKGPIDRVPESTPESRAEFTRKWQEGSKAWGEMLAREKSAGLKEDIDAAAADCEEPKSEEQARAGNYRHGHCSLHGMPITIETGKGMTRKGTDKDGKAWKITMAHHYGYIKRTESEADGDHIDVFIGPEPESEVVFIVDQVVGGKFDEHKCLLGFKSKEDAKAGYLACYADGWKGCGSITTLTIPQFKAWCADGDTSKPLAGQKLTHKQVA